MKSLFSISVISFSFFLSSCIGVEQKGEVQNSVPSPADSSSAERKVTAEPKEDFVSVLKGISISNINQYINKEKGLWLIQSSGAMPNMTNTSQVDKHFPIDFSAVIEEEIPKVNCDSKTFWTKDGCFAQQVNKFKDEKIWVYCSLDKDQVPKVADLAETISYTVINTALYARYYFSQIDGKWYLTFVDLRKPCEA